MVSSEIRRNMALFPIGIVMQLTELSARQIRYYEEQGLIQPARNQGKQRIFSLNDLDRLLEIKDLLDQGINIAGIKALNQLKEMEVNVLPPKLEKKSIDRDLTEKEVHERLRRELLIQRPSGKTSLIQGELSRFFQ